MGLSFFKRMKKVQEEPIIKTVEVEKKVYSRFTFAHDDTIDVKSYHLVVNGKECETCDSNCDSRYGSLPAGTVFLYNKMAFDMDYNRKIYPIFALPSSLPATKLISAKKVLCLGAIIIDADDEIQEFSNNFTGTSMEELFGMGCIDLLTEDSIVTVMNYKNVIEEVSCKGDINLTAFERFITVKNSLNLVMNAD